MEWDIAFRVLGTVRIRRDGGWHRAGSPQQQAVLTALLLRVGRLVTADGLVDAVWGDEPPASVITVLRTNVWRLRRTLERSCAGAQDILVSVGDGYRMDVPPESVDALRAEQLAVRAKELVDRGRVAEHRALLGEALALWDGVPLAGVPGPFARQQRDRLEELRFGLEEDRFEAELQAGNAASIIADATALSQESPLRERPHGLLMRALNDVGRRADALAVYGRVRTVLREELGIEPGTELRELQARILADGWPPPTPPEPLPDAVPVRDPAMDAGGSTGGRPLLAAPTAVQAAEFLATPAQLPAGIPDFTGREAELAALQSALEDGRPDTPLLVAINGMGGVGKSVLATRFAHLVKSRFPDGQLYADLYGTAADPEHPKTVLDGFLTALGVPRRALPAEVAEASRLLRTVLADRRVLLVLDDARDAAQVRRLLPGSAGCAVLVTSRAKLVGLPIAVQVDLREFSSEEAWELLRRVVGAQRVVGSDADAERLLAACSRLPLAVRIAAARLAARPQWSLDRLADRLSDGQRRLAELQIGDLAVATAFELSRRMLTEEQARAFRLLARTTRSATLGSAAAVLGLPEPDAEDLLESLVDAALLESPQPAGYRFHDLVREFAAQLPAESDDEQAEALDRLLHQLRVGAQRAFRAMVPGDPVADLLAPDCPDGAGFADLGTARAWVQAEVETAVEAARSAARDPRGTEPTLAAAADVLVLFSPFGREIPYDRLAGAAEAVATAAEQLGPEADRTLGRARFVCGNAELQSLRLDTAQAHALAAEAALRRAGDLALLHQVLNDLGLIAQLRERYAEAVRHYEEAATVARVAGHRASELVTTLNAALARIRDGHPEEARQAAGTALDPLRALGNGPGLGFALYVHGLALHELGRYPEAVSAFEECLAICRSAGLRGREAGCRTCLADSLRALGRLDRALLLAGQGMEQCRELGAERDTARALLVLGRVLGELGRPEEARERTAEALAEYTRLGLAEAGEAERQLAALHSEVRFGRDRSVIRAGHESPISGV